MVIVGVIGGVCQFCQTAAFQIFSENISFEIKKKYFWAALQKDASWFDQNNPNELASKISSESQAIARGSGDKVGVVYSALFQSLFGLIAAFVIGWEFALILLCFVPVIGFFGALYGIS